MAGTIGRLFVEIGGDTSKLTASLKQAVDNAAKAGIELRTAGLRAVEGFERALNPTKELGLQLRVLEAAGKSQADIWRVMGQQLSVAGDAARKNSQTIDPFVQKYLDLNKTAEGGRITFENFGKALTEFARNPLQAAQNGLTGLLESLGPMAIGIGAIATAAALAGKALFDMGASAAAEAEHFQNLAASTGLTVQQLQALEQIGKEAGLETLNLGRALGMLNRQLEQGEAGGFVKGLREFGINAKEAGNIKPLITLIDEFQAKLWEIPTASERAQKAWAAMGDKGLRDLIPLLLRTRTSLSELIETQKQWGPVTDEISQGKLLRLDDALDAMGRTLTSIGHDAKVIVGTMMAGFTEIGSSAEGGLGRGISALDMFRQELEKGRTKMLEFGGQFAAFSKINVESFTKTGKESLEDFEIRIKAVAEGGKTSTQLLIQLAKAEDDLKKAIKETASEDTKANRERELSAAKLVASIKDQIKAQSEAKKEVKEYQELLKRFNLTETEAETIVSKLAESIKEQAKEWRELNTASTAGLDSLDKYKQKAQELARAIENMPTRWRLPQIVDESKDILTPEILIPEEVQNETTRIAAKVGKESRDAFLNQVSTIGTDLSKSIVDGLSGGKFDIFAVLRDIGKSMLRALIETFLNPFIESFAATIKGLTSRSLGTAQAGAATGAAGLGSLWSASSRQAMMGTAGLALMADSLQRSGTRAWLESIGGGAAAGFSYGGPIGGLIGAGAGTFSQGVRQYGLLNTMFASGAFLPTGPLPFTNVFGQSAYRAGSREASRDFGTSIDFKQFLGNLGISEPTAYPIRKDIESSPVFLTQLGQLAKQQGTYNDFLSRLERINTAWGSFNFRKAYEIGDLTGNWTELDKAFTDAFQSSQALQQNLPNWKDLLTLTGDAAKKAASEFENLWQSFQQSGQMSQEFVDWMTQNKAALDAAAASSTIFAEQLDAARAVVAKFTELQPDIQGFQGLKTVLESLAGSATKDIYQSFLETGTITDELSQKIIEFGGDLAAFQRLADLSKLNADFEHARQVFLNTGEILPELSRAFREFGGDLSVLDNAGKLPGLLEGLENIKSLANSLRSLLDDPIRDLLSGKWGAQTWGALSNLGLDPSKLTGIADVTRFRSEWDRAISEFQSGTRKAWSAAQNKYIDVPIGLQKGGVLEQALWRYGGAAGTQAIEAYQRGFNIITPDLLAKTKSAMDADYQSTVKSALDYIETAQQKTTDTITSLQTAVTTEFDKVSKNLKTAIEQAALTVIGTLGEILKGINEIVNNTKPVAVPQAAAGGYVLKSGIAEIHQGETIIPSGSASGPTIIVNVNGPVMADNVDSLISEAVRRGYRRGDYAFLGAR